MKIGIVTYVKCDNYGAELQAFALQYKLNSIGYDAEVINLEKRDVDMKKNPDVIIGAILQRLKREKGFAIISIIKKVYEVATRIYYEIRNSKKIEQKHQLFETFFEKKIKHSEKYYTLDEISSTTNLNYDIFIAGSDQIWNYIHTDRLDVYFLMFANKFHAKKVSYAASISILDIPEKYRNDYKQYFENIDYLSVRELHGRDLVAKYSNKTAEVVLDPTFLISKEEWINEVAVFNSGINYDYLLVYTLSGSNNIMNIAKNIAKSLNLKIINIKSNFVPEDDNEITHLYNVGPCEWVGLWARAKYVVTDSFHGTAFSINFNIPFTVLVNPNSMMNSRVMSILKITGLESRIIYDIDDCYGLPKSMEIDFSSVNSILSDWKQNSLDFLINAIKN